MKKRIVSVVLVFILSLSLMPFTAAAYRDFSGAEKKAAALKSLGLFQGVSDNDFALNRAPTRAEALVMFIRLIGEEYYATTGSWEHPFTDVPGWADDYVGYAYEKGYTNGVSGTTFGTNDTASSATYLTFVLRALAYSDGSNGDFVWNDPYTLAENIGLLTDDVNTSSFLRADVVLVSWNALALPMNGGNKAMADLLVMSGVFSQAQLDEAFASVEGGGAATVNGIKMGTYTCYTDSYGNTYDTAYRPSFTLNYDMSFTISVNMGEGMSTGTGTWSAEELDTGEIGVHLYITSAAWSNSDSYSFIFYDNTMSLSDGGMGITPVDSVFEF